MIWQRSGLTFNFSFITYHIMNIKPLFFLIFILASININAQSGWTKAKGQLYSQVTVSYFSSNRYFATNGNLFDSGNNFQSQSLLLYGEYGITDRLTGLANIPLVQFNSFSNTDIVAGVGDIQLGIKYALSKEFPLAISFEAAIPTSDGIQFAQAKEVNEIGIREEINLPTSDGEFNLWTTLAASKSMANGNTYGSLFASFNMRTQGFSHQVKVGAELGHLFFYQLWVIGKLNILESLSDSPNTSVPFIYGEGTTYTAASVNLLYQLNDHWSLTAIYSDYFDFLVSKKNIYDAPSISLGVAFEL